MSDTPETQEAIERWRQGKINIFDEMARLERERNKARESLRAARDRCQKIGRQRNRLNAENERLIKKAMPPHPENPETE